MKKLLSVALSVVLLVSAVVIGQGFTQAETYDPGAAVRTFDLSAADFVKNIKAGWNLGNTLECYTKSGTVTYGWSNCELNGNPQDANGNIVTDPTYWESTCSWSHYTVTSQALINTVKQAGFNAIRIPCSWFAWSDYDATTTLGNGVQVTGDVINPVWFTRVKQIVQYALNQDMYIILNMHHDDAVWLHTDLYGEEWEYVKTRYTNFWKQIAYEFRDYDARLILEGMNEIVGGSYSPDWLSATQNGYNHLNELYQLFVDIVRSSGGNNDERYLAISPWGAHMQHLDKMVLPKTDGKTDEHLIIDVHNYNEICYGNISENFINFLSTCKAKYLSQGVGVIIGESAYRNSITDPQRVEATKQYYAASKYYGIPIFQWDNGCLNSYSKWPNKWHILNRETLTWDYPLQLSAMMDTVYNKNVLATSAVPVTEYKYYNGGAGGGDITLITRAIPDHLLKNSVWQVGYYDGITGALDTTSDLAKRRAYTNKIDVVPGETYEIKLDCNYSSVFRMLAIGYDANGNAVTLGTGYRTGSGSQGKAVSLNYSSNSNGAGELLQAVAVTIPDNVVKLGISMCMSWNNYPSRASGSDILFAINEGAVVPMLSVYGGTPGSSTTTTTTTTTTTAAVDPDDTNRYMYLKGRTNNVYGLSMTFPNTTIPQNTAAITMKVKSSAASTITNGLSLRSTTNGQLAGLTADFDIAFTTEWNTVSIDLTGVDLSQFHSYGLRIQAVNGANSYYYDDIRFVDANGNTTMLVEDFQSYQAGDPVITGFGYWEGEAIGILEENIAPTPTSSTTTTTTTTTTTAAVDPDDTNRYMYLKGRTNNVYGLSMTFPNTTIPQNTAAITMKVKSSAASTITNGLSLRSTTNGQLAGLTADFDIAFTTEWNTVSIDLTGVDLSQFHSYGLRIQAVNGANSYYYDDIRFVDANGNTTMLVEDFQSYQAGDPVITGFGHWEGEAIGILEEPVAFIS